MPLPRSAIDLIETWRLGFLATVSPDGMPNVSPKGTFAVLDPDTIGFAEMRSPKTMANLAHTPQIEVNFVDILSRRGIRIRGTARVIPRDAAEYATLLPAFVAHWADLEPEFNAIVKIAVDGLAPLQSPAYELGTTEDEFRALWKAKIKDMP